MANQVELKKEAEQYLTKMKAKYQTDTRDWERFAREVPDKFLQLIKSGIKPSISRGDSGYSGGTGRTLSVSLSFETNMDAAKEYLESLKKEIPRRGEAFGKTIESFDAQLQKYYDAGLEGEILEKLAKHFAQWVEYSKNLYVQIRDAKISVELPAKYIAKKKQWLELADKQKLEEDAARYGIAVADVPKHRKYLEARQKKAMAKTSAAMNQAIRQLQEVGGYLDTQALIREAKNTADQMRLREAELERIRKAEEEKRRKEEEARKEEERKAKRYREALQDMKSNSEERVARARTTFLALNEYRDAKEQADTCVKQIERIKEEKERERKEAARKAEAERKRREEEERCRRLEEEERQRRLEEEEHQRRLEEEARRQAKKKKQKRIAIILAAIAAVALAAFLTVTLYVIPNNKYVTAEKLLAEGKKAEAAMMFGSAGNYSDARERSFALWDEVANRDTLAAGGSNHVGESFFGGISKTGDPLVFDTEGDVSADGGDYIAVAASGYDVYFLNADGTVTGQPGWKDIVDIAAGGEGSLFGLKSDGTVVAILSNNWGNETFTEGFENWTNIVDLAVGYNYVVGLKADGTVTSAAFSKTCDNYYGELNVGGWTDIVKIAVGSDVTLGLKTDGTVVAVGSNYYGTAGGASKWTDIVDITAFRGPVAGLRSDGTVVIAGASGDNNHGESAAIEWKDIVMVESGNFYVLGVKADGTILVAGKLQKEPEAWPHLKNLAP